MGRTAQGGHGGQDGCLHAAAGSAEAEDGIEAEREDAAHVLRSGVGPRVGAEAADWRTGGLADRRTGGQADREIACLLGRGGAQCGQAVVGATWTEVRGQCHGLRQRESSHRAHHWAKNLRHVDAGCAWDDGCWEAVQHGRISGISGIRFCCEIRPRTERPQVCRRLSCSVRRQTSRNRAEATRRPSRSTVRPVRPARSPLRRQLRVWKQLQLKVRGQGG